MRDLVTKPDVHCSRLPVDQLSGLAKVRKSVGVIYDDIFLITLTHLFHHCI